MPANLLAGKSVDRRPEEKAVSYRGISCHGRICRPVAGICGVILREGKGKASAGNRRELFILVNNAYHSICLLYTSDAADE